MDAQERQTVDFSCEVNQVDVDGRWYREDCRIRPGDNIRIRHQGEAVACTPAAGACSASNGASAVFVGWGSTAGRTHTLSFKSVRPEHAGEIRFTAERVSSYATLTVTGEPGSVLRLARSFVDRSPPAASALGCLFSELPVQIVRPLRVKIAMYRHRGLLECQVSRPSAQVKWYKNRKELLPGPKYQAISQDVYRQLHIEDVRSSDEDTYTCDAGDDRTSCQLLVEGELAQTNGRVSQGCSHVTGPR